MTDARDHIGDDSGAWLVQQRRWGRGVAVAAVFAVAGLLLGLTGCAAGGRALGFRLEMAIQHPDDMKGRLSVDEMVRLQAAAQAQQALDMLAATRLGR